MLVKAIVFCAFSMVAVGNARASSVPSPETADMLTLFGQACIATHGHEDRVRSYARQQHLSSNVTPDGVKLFAGEGTGAAAWSVRVRSTLLVLAIRTSYNHACAVFAPRADVDYLQQDFFGALLSSMRGSHLKLTPDRVDDTPFGKHVAKIVTGSNFAGQAMSIVLITYERPGATWQATLQISEFAP